MTIRLFRCKACNHKYRLGSNDCGYCFRPTAPWNRWWFLLGLLVLAGLGAARYFGLV